MNMDENSMSHMYLTKEDLVGSYEWKGDIDLINIVMLGLSKDLPEHDKTYELHRLLGALLFQKLTVDEKINIIGNEYEIPMEDKFREDVSVMCNLSQGIKEEGIEIGRAEGEMMAFAKLIRAKKMTPKEVAAMTGMTETELLKAIEKLE